MQLTNSKLERVERMLVDFVQLGLHLDGEVNQIAEMSILVLFRLEGVNAGSGHVSAADCLDLLNRSKLFIVQNLVEIN